MYKLYLRCPSIRTGGLVSSTVAETGTPGGHIGAGGGSKEVQVEIKNNAVLPLQLCLVLDSEYFIFVSNIVKGGPEISCLARR